MKTPTSSSGATGGQAGGRERGAGGDATLGHQAPARNNLRGASGSEVARGTAAGAGGVRGTSTPDGRTAATQPGLANAGERSTALAAWDRAESALARERLPLELRTYVRSYLAAVRPEGRQP